MCWSVDGKTGQVSELGGSIINKYPVWCYLLHYGAQPASIAELANSST